MHAPACRQTGHACANWRCGGASEAQMASGNLTRTNGEFAPPGFHGRSDTADFIGFAARWTKSWVIRPLPSLWEIGRGIGKVLPGMRDDLLFRRFWGEGTRSSDAYFVIDSYEDVRLRNNFRRTEDQLQVIEKGFVPGEVIHGSFSPQAAAMLAAFFSRHGARVPQIVSDIEIGLNR